MTEEEKQFFVDLIGGVKGEIHGEMQSMKDELRSEMQSMKKDLQKQIDAAQAANKDGLMLLQKEVRRYREETRQEYTAIDRRVEKLETYRDDIIRANMAHQEDNTVSA